MATWRCMNVSCAATDPGGGGSEWRKGWPLRSGGFAVLCINCGMAYERLVFCDIFHQKESGWRECHSCGKQLHCGCIASKFSLDLLDSGGVQCLRCMKNSELSLIPTESVPLLLPRDHQRLLTLSARSLKDEMVNDNDSGIAGSLFEISSFTTDRKVNINALTKGKSMNRIPHELRENECGSFGQIKWEQMALKVGDAGITGLANRYEATGSTPMSQQDECKDVRANKTLSESLAKACIGMNMGTGNHGNKSEGCFTAERPFISLDPLSMTAEGMDQNKVSAFHQMQRSRCFLSKPPKAGTPSDASKDVLSHMRVARPPAEGRGRNQLLPRYWPRITDQELQQISGDSNSTIVPLFEKVLSASDAGRIGRLVLPKACAEAYFPPISQPEGVPLTIQDAKGKEWHFQFRFWPNNNSRMYVLEGVTPCIQSLQLQAGDTVTFSRIDPEGKLVMGFRKATNNVPLQDSQISAIANCALGSESFFSGATENSPIVSGYSGLLQQLKGSGDLHLTSQSEHMNSVDGDFNWYKTDKYGVRANDGLQMQPSYKRSRNIGGSRRMLMDRDEALELKITWEEVQDLLRPPPSERPSIVMIEDHEVEEYEEPPVFGKKTIFTARTSGDQDQWVQCDDCSKWRRLPADVLLPSRWTCADNTCDPKRFSCAAPAELSQKEIQMLVQQCEDLGRQRSLASLKQGSSDLAASGLDALAAVAALKDEANQLTSVATTTKHPRHRLGCTCIVCIQPPSGKGPKHNPACTCNVCMTVKRRFKTLMMRKKKRQSEREEAETLKKLAWVSKDDTEGTSSSMKNSQPLDSQQDNDLGPAYNSSMIEKLDDQIDLNSQPGHDEGVQSIVRLSMMSLLQVANRPLETYLKQNGLASLACEQGDQESPSSVTLPQAPSESEGKQPDEGCHTSAAEERESGGADEASGSE